MSNCTPRSNGILIFAHMLLPHDHHCLSTSPDDCAPHVDWVQPAPGRSAGNWHAELRGAAGRWLLARGHVSPPRFLPAYRRHLACFVALLFSRPSHALPACLPLLQRPMWHHPISICSPFFGVSAAGMAAALCSWQTAPSGSTCRMVTRLLWLATAKAMATG